VKTKSTLPESVLKENRALCEATDDKLCAVRERASFAASEGATTHGGTKPVKRERDGRTEYLAQVGEANVPGANGRIYSRRLWEQNIDRYKPLLEKGFMTGAVDHLDHLAGGNLKSTPVIHRELFMDGDRVMSWYQIVEGHSDGANLKAQKEAGMAIGWSTFGYGRGRPATEEDRKSFRIPADASLEFDQSEGPHYVVMEQWRLVKADAVDDPSFASARDQRESGGAPGAYPFTPAEKALTAKALSEALRETDARREAAVAEGAGSRGSKAPEPTSVQYTSHKSGDLFMPAADTKFVKTLDAHAYRVECTPWGPQFVKMRPQTDELMQFAGSSQEKVLKEINDFWSADTVAKYEKLGALHNRGILLYGPPGTGKTCALHQAAESVVAQGDVVFYADNVYELIGCLGAFREVEPKRKVVVALEDADNWLGYQERAFLQLLDGEQSLEHVLYLSTTNYLERFPPRLLRPGRFDKKVYVGPPPYEGRLAYLTKKLDGVESRPEEIERLAKATDGLSFGHLRELVLAVYALSEPVDEVLSRLTKGAVRREAACDGTTDDVQAINQAIQEAAKTGGTVAVRVRAESTRLGEQMDIKTLEQLKEHAPEAFAAHEAAVTAAVKSVEDQLVATQAIVKAVEAALNGALPALKENLSGLVVPERQIEDAALKTQVETLTKDLTAANAAKSAAESKLAGIEAEKADADRRSKVSAKVEALVKDLPVYAEAIRVAVQPRLADKAFGEADVEAFVKAKQDEYAKLVPAGEQGPGPKLGAKGSGVVPPHEETKKQSAFAG
jgi:hypothetical protein